MTDILSIALSYFDAGLTPIPIVLDGSKSPALRTWRAFYKERPTREQVTKLFKGKSVGVALLGGPTSGGLEIIDIETPDAFTDWADLVGHVAPELLARLPIVKSPRGFHVYFRSEHCEGNRKLAMSLNPAHDPKDPKKEPKTKTKIETRGNGGYVLAPGSPGTAHPTGLTYEPVSVRCVAICEVTATPTITSEERAHLIDCARSLNEVAEHDEPERKHETTPSGEGRPGDDFESRASWDEILSPHGWKLIRRRGDAAHWQRPGKDDKGISATTGVAGVGGKFYVFSSNAHPFDASHAYSKFRVYAFLNHAGDFAAAARELKAKGFGERAKQEAARAAQRQTFAQLNDRLDTAFSPRPPQQEEAPPMPSDDDAPTPGVVQMTATDLEKLLEDDRAAALIEPTFSRLLASRDDDAEWQRILFMLQRFKAVKLFQEKVKKHDKSARGRGAGADWKEQLIYRENKSGEMVLESCLTNYITILLHDPKWAGVLAFDEFANQIVTRKPPPFKRQLGRWGDADALEVRSWLETAYGLRMNTQAVCEAILVVSKRCAFNALVEYLDGLSYSREPGDESILDTWLIDFFGAPDTPYVRAVGAKWMIAAAARAYEPGCQVDTVLILEGKQGSKKSSVLKQLCPSFEWFTDGLSDFGSKAQAEEVEGKWIVELGEMKGFGKELEQIKAFITRRAENYRPAYARYSVHSPRKCVFAATVNPTAAGYLRDETGNRRYWPIECTKQAPTLTPEMRDRMWAEAVARYKAKEQWWIEDEELQQAATNEQEKRVVLDPWHELIEQHIVGSDSTSTDEILNKLNVDTSKRGTSDLMRVGRIMTALKWEKYQQRWPDGRRTWRYKNPKYAQQQSLPLGEPTETHAA